jgi:uncharacterized protein YndB with AHSA1/START domain
MNEQNVQHATMTLERTYRAPLERVFSEFADPVVRARWSPPSNDALIYDEADFRVGGRDVFRCGPRNDLRFRGETSYQVIVPNKCVISSETLDTDGRRIAVSLTTLDLEDSGAGVKLKLTVQIASLAGTGMFKEFESGYKSALENLDRHLFANP